MNKAQIREDMLAHRRLLVSATVAEAARTIAARLRKLPEIQRSAALMTYVGSKDNEVDTLETIAWALGEGKTVLVPVCMPGRAMGWSLLRDVAELAPSPFGIFEPRQGTRELVLPPADAPVLVPGIAFDTHGYRIGYGAGYFDRYLVHHTGAKIGLAYECQLLDPLPREPHDVPMDIIVTECGVHECGGSSREST